MRNYKRKPVLPPTPMKLSDIVTGPDLKKFRYNLRANEAVLPHVACCRFLTKNDFERIMRDLLPVTALVPSYDNLNKVEDGKRPLPDDWKEAIPKLLEVWEAKHGKQTHIVMDLTSPKEPTKELPTAAARLRTILQYRCLGKAMTEGALRKALIILFEDHSLLQDINNHVSKDRALVLELLYRLDLLDT